MTPPLLSFQNLTFLYPGAKQAAIQHLDLDIPSGSVTAILGPNGAGKTTLLHLALGWLKPAEGEVLFDGQALKQYSRRELGQRMGLVPQTEHVPFEYSLLEFTMLGRSPYLNTLDMPGDEDIRVALDALDQVGLLDYQRRSMTALSGGERQLVLVARALAQQPRLLLLDESSSHLDLSNKRRLVHLLAELNKKGVTVILTTHEPDIASLLATHLVLMRSGQVLETGTFDQIFQSDSLSKLYQIPLEVVETHGKRMVLWE